MTDFPTLSYTSSSEIPYNPFVYLKPEEGTPFGWNLPIQVIIGSAHHPPPPPPERLKQIKQHIELAIHYATCLTCSQFSLTIFYTGMEGGNRVA